MPFTTTYAALLGVGSFAVARLDGVERLRALRAVSTNLANLAAGHVETLFVSAFVPADVVVPLLLVAVAGMALSELLLTWRTALLAFAVGHVAVSLAVAALLALRALPGVAADGVEDAIDTGPSYGAAAVIGAGLVVAVLRAAPAVRGRLHTFVLALPVAAPVAAMLLLAASPTFSAWGHLFALLTGAGVGVGAVVHARSRRPSLAGGVA